MRGIAWIGDLDRHIELFRKSPLRLKMRNRLGNLLLNKLSNQVGEFT